MRYLALATDYDETLAAGGTVLPSTVDALRRLRASGRRVVLVTGRELGSLRTVFPALELFDRIVAENGALLYRPDTGDELLLGEPPPRELVDRLLALNVSPLSVGRAILATREPHEIEALHAIRELGLERQVIFNRGSVMILPTGVNKQTGLAAALAELDLSPRNTVAVGDAENDHALLAACECGVAVANALRSLKDRADWVTREPSGLGVEGLIERLLEDDLRSLAPRQTIALGLHPDGTEALIPSHGRRILVAGPRGSGKRRFVTGLLERLSAAGYQSCILDPDGDYAQHDGVLAIGSAGLVPSPQEVIDLLQRPSASVSVNLAGLAPEERPRYFAKLLPLLQDLRARTGRPHWLVLDEAHDLFPPGWEPDDPAAPRELGGLLLISSRPKTIPAPILAALDTAVAAGAGHLETLGPFLDGRELPAKALGREEILVWTAGRLDRLRLAPDRAVLRAAAEVAVLDSGG